MPPGEWTGVLLAPVYSAQEGIYNLGSREREGGTGVSTELQAEVPRNRHVNRGNAGLSWFAIFSPVILLICSLVVFLTYLVPEWRAFLRSDVFVFTNGWDEEIYLSWQGTALLKDMIGFFPMYLNWVLQNIGMSGALQNLLFDTVLPPATALLAYLALRTWNVDSIRAVGYATLFCFGSVLFNANNPYVSDVLGQTRSATVLIMAAWEVYPSILRTPNPEIPFFLVACAVYGYARFQRKWILLLPLPILYYHTAIPYVFVLTMSALYSEIRSRTSATRTGAILIAALVTFCGMALGLICLSYFMGFYQADHPWKQEPYIFSATRRPQLPLGLIALIVLFALARLSNFMKFDNRMLVAVAILAVASLGSVNFHIATGYMLEQKNYYDYGLSIFFSIMAAILIESIRNKGAKTATLAVTLLVIALFSSRSQKIWFDQAMQQSQAFSPYIDKLRVDSLRAIVTDLDAAARIPYSTARLPATPISYPYYIFGIQNQCPAYPGLLNNALAFSKEHLPQDSKALTEISKTATSIEAVRLRHQDSTKLAYSYCREFDFENRNFYFVGRTE
jgi:hypothetical protein